jgi:hypothetical protein
MSKLMKILLGALLVSVAAVGVAVAKRGHHGHHMGYEEHMGEYGGKFDGVGHHGRRGGGRGGEHGGGRMQMLDVNGDGVIGDDEAASVADRMFQRLDRDGDGAFTAEEFSTGGRGHGRRWFGTSDTAATDEARKKAATDRFAMLDVDKNGRVNKVEFFAAAKARLLSADADKDGKVTPWEYRAAN